VAKKIPIDLSALLSKYEISDEDLKAECNKRIARTRKSSGGPPPEKKEPCIYCREEYGVVAMRKHTPRCPQNPNRRKGIP
jgi:hypothetical protein